jgi:hypothetical protein
VNPGERRKKEVGENCNEELIIFTHRQILLKGRIKAE